MLYPTIWRRRVPSILDEVLNMRNEFDRLLGRADTDVAGAWGPVVDVRETKDELVIQAELPGLAAEDVDVSVEGGVLTISGEKKQEVEEGKEGSNYHLVERRYGRFERSFSLPRSVDPEKVAAEFDNGVLMITLPKAEAAKPRRIEVKASNSRLRLGSKK
ncbi:MAG: Hsp20 family protein [Gemmatimonadales bacterium]|nr:Hsp20 family protein [Gemmatimonadales bacterium]NIN50678.1 Hsp20 family protein [Gemmatimonadales bacterium]NIP08142.1 Hsp20 family protein [Gemmatimonadales bacterium]NIR01020.1 Hsp20 family protein [Gemmatimonadales bacterium]NIS65099.1 Hsp20 family protein [Gemmatimonadales bacterium]